MQIYNERVLFTPKFTLTCDCAELHLVCVIAVAITDVIQMLFSPRGLSLPKDTGRGLSEHGDASRDTLSESSSLKMLPIELSYGDNYNEDKKKLN